MYDVLNYRTVVEINGKDCFSFLQGLITQDMHLVRPDKPQYGLMLTGKGRFYRDFFIIKKGEGYWLTPAKEGVDSFIKKLSLYRLKSDVHISELKDMKVAVGESPQGLDLVFKDPRHNNLGYVYVGPQSGFLKNGSLELYHKKRLDLNIVEGPIDLEVEKTIPLEAGLDTLNAISWTKGCYLGQELTSRTKHVGMVRKKYMSFEAGSKVMIGGTVMADGEEVGIIKSTYQEGQKGFCLLRDEAKMKQLFMNDVGIRLLQQENLF